MSEKNSNMASPLPWFRMFAANYLADRNFRTISLEERGLVLSMLLECWTSIDIPKKPEELSQILGVPVDQVKRALTFKALSFFEERGNSYHSKFLDDQRNKFLEIRKARKEGGEKGAALKKIKKINAYAQPLGQPEGTLHQLPSSPVNSFSVNQEGKLTDSEHVQHKEWLDDYDNATSPFQSKFQS
ncbi:MAG: hypothetical protein KGQ65_01730 [Burkholderiales bacterium]|jgi:uncharacterized protein YdaU (DUF1376 family)|nr:hypothetical protein [Burkholderiales bacterium]